MGPTTMASPASGPQYGSANWAPIPAQQQNWLNQLSSSGQLSGIPPQYLAAMDWAESNGMGGSVNSEGYGGFFGLASGTQYPNGSLRTAQLTGTDQASFNAQATTAAAELAKLIKSTDGNVYVAEQLYQGGSTEGYGVMQQYGLSPLLDVGTLSAATPASGSPASGSGSLMGACTKADCIIGTPFGIGGCLMDQCQAKAFVSGLLVLGGGLITLVGVALLVSSSKTGQQLMKLAPVAYGADQLGKLAKSPGKSSSANNSSGGGFGEDDLANAHAQGVAKGQAMGANTKKRVGGYAVNPNDTVHEADEGEF